MSMSKVVAIIPARGGSKGVPRKNIRPLMKKPLIAWTIEQANHSRLLSRVIVSTEDEEIAAIARECGADVPFMRPVEYAQDSSPTSEAILHALDSLENMGETYDYITLLEPTSPLRKADDIDRALSLLLASPDHDALISLGEVHTEHPLIIKKIVNGVVYPYLEKSQSIWQRQQVDLAYFPYGVIYAVKVDTYRKHKTFYLENVLPYLIERWQNYEIDDFYDFIVVEAVMQYYMQHGGTI